MKKVQQLHDRAVLAISPAALVLAQVNIKPDKSKAPGAKGLEEVVNGFAWYALIAAAAPTRNATPVDTAMPTLPPVAV